MKMQIMVLAATTTVNISQISQQTDPKKFFHRRQSTAKISILQKLTVSVLKDINR